MRKTILLLLITLSLSRGANADPITVSGSGTLTEVEPIANEKFFSGTATPGAPFTFALTFSSPASDLDADPTTGLYSLDPGRVAVTLGTATFTREWPVIGRVSLEAIEGADELALISTGGFPPPPTEELVGIHLFAFLPAGDLLTSDAWPVDLARALNAAAFNDFSVSATVALGDGGFLSGSIARGQVSHFTQVHEPAPVPEPSTLLLLGSGLLGAAGARRWRQRKV